jgi:glycosyltransferase involved in cell wall biosynthesis
MAYGLPVITTKGSPWSDLIEFKCGWWINADKSAIAMALKSATSMEPGELSIMGERARRYIMRFGWSTVAEKTAALYAWIQRCGPKPDFIDN